MHVAAAIAFVLAVPTRDDAVAIESGRVTGKSAGEGVRAYLGIPFAAPPVGPLRWRPPEPPAPWQGVRACDHFGPSCPQPISAMSASGGGGGEQSEDCLYLNVWTPTASQDAKLPVMVWIHGGGFFLGSGSGTSYDGANLARRQVVVVTINYRLGPFGFLGHPALSKESPHGASGNYGLLDQIAALQWVQKNVAAFGGDPGSVTIFGESAGAFSVGCLLVSPLARGLFHRAIAESGAAIWIARGLREPGMREEPVEVVGERVVLALVGGTPASSGGEPPSPIAAARAKSAEELLAAAKPTLRLLGGGEGNVFGPAIDGWVVPDAPWRLFESGRVNVVPLLIGSNADEGTLFVGSAPPASLDQEAAAMRAVYGPIADRLLAYYSVEKWGDPSRVRAELIADSTFVAPTRAQVRAMAQAGAPCFVYHFTRVAGGARRTRLGAFHASEIAYVFGNLQSDLLRTYDANDGRLSATMMNGWVQFARTGDPNGDGLPSWHAYVEEEDGHLEFGDEVKTGSGLHGEACDLWDEAFTAWREHARR